MKRFLIALLCVSAFFQYSGAQGFLDGFERALDKLTGNEPETVTVKDLKGRAYGANPGLDMICREAGVKGDIGFLLLTFVATGDTVKNVVLSSSDSATALRFNVPEVADSLVAFVVSPAYEPLVGNHGKKTEKGIFNVGTPSVRLVVPAGEAVDVMVTCGGFPKKVNRFERIDVQMKHTQPEGGDRYFGFTVEDVALKSSR